MSRQGVSELQQRLLTYVRQTDEFKGRARASQHSEMRERKDDTQGGDEVYDDGNQPMCLTFMSIVQSVAIRLRRVVAFWNQWHSVAP